MSVVEMRKPDLGELYALLGMYRMTYGGVPEELMDAVEAAYERSRGLETPIGNPRGAGRKSSAAPEKIRKAKQLREKGWQIRKIAAEMGCSVGHVHKLIHEQEAVAGGSPENGRKEGREGRNAGSAPYVQRKGMGSTERTGPPAEMEGITETVSAQFKRGYHKTNLNGVFTN